MTLLSVETEQHLITTARRIRKNVLTAIHAVGTGHAGSSLSLIEILVMLYFRHLKIDPKCPNWEDRDWFILSKGHGSPALYATLAAAGYFSEERLQSLRQFGSGLHGHPVAGQLPGIDVSTGSLGQGLSIAVGLALGFMRQGRTNRVVCILGDGELQEGQNWEAANTASTFGVANLCCIVDRNGLQNDGDTETIMPLGDLCARFRAFGWQAMEIDGHNFQAIDKALWYARQSSVPCILVAKTVKGRGVSFMEGVVKWHHHPIDNNHLVLALSELDGALM
ncbi:MAG: transketolase [Tildeniella nuda ZEHNDER 1965/U140]|jgi:transketolase|nr:transketolase [Tildeniella nuda ZEHNDER 1965/U140]